MQKTQNPQTFFTMKTTKPLQRIITFTIKGNLTQVQVDATDPRSDSEIIKGLKSKRKDSILTLRAMNKELKLTKDLSLPSSGRVYNIPSPRKVTPTQNFINNVISKF